MMVVSEGYTKAALFEHRFWLQVLGDHCRFIQASLDPKEAEEVAKARSFIERFDQLLANAREPLGAEHTLLLSKEAERAAHQLREYKLHLLQRHLTGPFGLKLPPTFINHMVNELDEYERILSALRAGELPPRFHPVHHHILWLSDAEGHAAALADSLDMTEKRLIEKSELFQVQFRDFYSKAVEMAGYLRTQLRDFPSLRRFHQESSLAITLFTVFLRELQENRLDAQVLGTLMPLMADHMAREECYYLTKLAETTDVPQPDCDPTQPRFEV